MMRRLFLSSGWVLACCCVLWCALATKAQAETLRVYVGTYTDGSAKGIYYFDFDTETGQGSDPRLAVATTNPSFLAIHPTGKYLYSTTPMQDDKGQYVGGLAAFAVEEDGSLRPLNKESVQGGGPCHVSVDATGRCILAANYRTGSVSALPIKDDGSLGELSCLMTHSGTVADPRRQGRPRAHSVTIDAGNRYAVAADLGLDRLYVYQLDPASATLKPSDPPSLKLADVSGPRHFDFHPNGKYAYAINEIDCTLSALGYDAEQGVLTHLETLSTLPEGYERTRSDSTADVHVHPSGKFVYGSNRGHDSIAMFAIDGDSGKLTLLGQESTQGRTPRNFTLDPSGRWLLAANQDSDTIVVFAIDADSGKLKPTGAQLKVGSPVCLKFYQPSK